MASAGVPLNYSTLTEKVRVLTGETGATGKPMSALRRGEVATALSTLAKMQSDQLTAAPTMADYNKLQADIATLFSVVQRLAALKSS